MSACLALLVALATLLLPLAILGRVRELHHGYYGLAFVALGLLGGGAWLTLAALGATLYADDLYQHVRQLWQRDYASPLHRAFAWPYAHWAWVRALTARLDHLLGKV